MAVIITDMKFPKRCLDCQLMGREKMYCQLHPRKDLNVVRVVSEKPEWCPLKEVSDKPSGKWIANAPQYDMLNPQYICSECGNAHIRTTPYCEMCGAKMVELQESEENTDD